MIFEDMKSLFYHLITYMQDYSYATINDHTYDVVNSNYIECT